jgi:transcription initiation factor TFIID subunit 5
MDSASSPSQSVDATAAPNPASSQHALDALVLEYLRSRGHAAAEQALQNHLGVDGIVGPSTIDPAELAQQLAKFSGQPDGVKVEDGAEPGTLQLMATVAAAGAEEILSADPTDRYQGFRELEAWVDGSLDMYRVRRLSMSHPSSLC